MIRSIGILLAACLTGSMAAATVSSGVHNLSTESAIHLLHGSGQSTIRDHLGYTYRIFKVAEFSELQALIDAATARLLATGIGLPVCFDLLEANPRLLVMHLGVSPGAAAAIASACAKQRAHVRLDSVVYNDPEREPRRLTADGRPAKRQYMIVVTDNPHFPLDSWTEAISNLTTLVLHHSPSHSDLNLRYIMQTVAHELAIYFDGKSWPWGPGWNRVPELANITVNNSTPDMVAMAAVNPAISSVLAFIRAYKIEREMVKELLSQGHLGSEPIYYPFSEFPFLRLSCRKDCLKEYILHQIKWLEPIGRPLLAFAPHYRARRLDYERLQSAKNRVPIADRLMEVLQEMPVSYLEKYRSKTSFLETILELPGPAETQAQLLTHQLMRDELIPEELEILFSAEVYPPNRRDFTMDMLTFLTIPLLTDANSSLSAGPRPRIRTGGTE
jgi:hypothetical protein